MQAHATAVVHTASRIAEDVIIGPYAVIEDGVEIGAGCLIREHAVIRCGSVLGAGCQIDAHAVVGGLPQDLGFDPRVATGVRLGAGVVLREGVTISRATREGTFTEVGAGCYLMANSHVAHDCKLGEKVILANAVLMGGHVSIGDYAFIGGAAAIHQFIRIGESVMISGLSRVAQDLPPFCLAAERNELVGLNLVGLQRRGCSREEIREIKKLFHMVYATAGRVAVLAEGLQRDGMAKTEFGKRFLHFLQQPSKKGVMRPDRLDKQ